MVDKFYAARAKRLAAEDKIEEMKKGEAKQKEEILRALTAAGLESATGKLTTASITKTDIAKLADPVAFFAHVLQTGEVDLIEKRASKSACAARWERGEEVPGVTRESRIDLSFTKSHR
jgi:hypothetical protein